MFSGPLSDKTEAQKVSYLLLWTGEKGRDIFSTFKFAPAIEAIEATEGHPAVLAVPAESKNDLGTVFLKFKQYTTPKSNIIFSRYKFYKRVQGEQEPVDNFVMDINEKLVDRGLDTVTYLPNPSKLDEMISVIQKHLYFTVEAAMKAHEPLFTDFFRFHVQYLSCPLHGRPTEAP